MKPCLIEPLESRYAPAVLVGINSPTINEGTGGTVTMTFTVTLSEAAGTNVSVDYATEDISAFATKGDYVSESGTLSFGPGEQSKQITITVNSDALDEIDETFRLNLSNPTGDIELAQTSAIGTITDDDAPSVISVGPATFNEASGKMTFTVTLNKESGRDVVFQARTLDVTATAGSDYTAFDEEITIPEGQTSVTIEVDLINDTVLESSETLKLQLSNPQNATFSNSAATLEATGTIVDNDGLGISVEDFVITEGTNGATQRVVTFTIRLAQAPTEDLTVDYTTANGTALAGLDYFATSGKAQFKAAYTDSSGQSHEAVTSVTVSVVIVQDALNEADEEVFYLNLSNPTGGATLTDAQGQATIQDDDVTPKLTIRGPGNQKDATIFEGNDGFQAIPITLSLSGGSAEAITVKLSTADDTALAGLDFLGLDQEITFAPGETTKTIYLSVLGDRVDEVDERLVLNVAKVSGGALDPQSDSSGSLTLRNDDRRIVVSNNGLTVTEGDAAGRQLTFTVTLDAASSHPVSFKYATVNGSAIEGADYTAKNGTLTFAPGETTKTITIDIVGDLAGEADENFSLSFTDVTNATISQTSVQGTILDNDPYLVISDGRVIEGAANTTSTMQFTVTLLRGGSGPVTVNYATAQSSGDDNATEGTDYIAKTGTLTFNPGETTKTISIQIKGDGDQENDEQFFVNLTTPEGSDFTITDDQGVGTIVDDEGILVISNASIVEGNSGTANMIFVVNLLNRPSGGGAVTVNFTTVDGSAISTGANFDFTAITDTLTFDSGVNQRTIVIPIRGDLTFEGNQTFSVVLSSASTGISIGTDTAIGTIIDNDPRPTVSITAANVFEGNSSTQLAGYTITLSNPSDLPVTVDFATQGGTATSDVDYTALLSTLTFAPGETTKTISVSVLGDTANEPDETIIGVLSNVQGATLGTSAATAKILNDDVVIDLVGFEATEGTDATKTMRIKFSSLPAAGTTVELNFRIDADSATAGSDYTYNGATMLPITAGDLTPYRETEGGPILYYYKDVSFNIVNDGVNEIDETFSVTLTSATNAKIGTATATNTIHDNDATPTFSIGDASIVETNLDSDGKVTSQTMTFVVTLSGPSSQAMSVKAFTENGTALASTGTEGQTGFVANDYKANDQLLTFNPGETSKTFTVTIYGDNTDEVTETFSVKLADPTSNDTLATATGTIVDNDQRALRISDARIAEGKNGQTSKMVFTVSIPTAASQDISFTYATADGTAKAGEDYTAGGDTLTLAAGQTSKTFEIDITGDGTLEFDELFYVRLSNPVNATIADGEGIGRIIADESNYKLTGGGVVEEDVTTGTTTTGTKVTFTITRGGDTTQPGTVSYTTVDGTATSSGPRPDYTAKSGVVTFAPGETTKTVEVQITADTHYENDETFFFRLTDSTNGALVNDGDATEAPQASIEKTVTIRNTDAVPTISIGNASVTEGNANATANMVFTVTLSAVDEVHDIIVNYSTLLEAAGTLGAARDTAASPFPQDFDRQENQSLTITKGSASGTFSIVVRGDTVDEYNETFKVKLNSAGYNVPVEGEDPDFVPIVITAAQGTGTIIDDDAAPGLSAMDFTVTEGTLSNTTAAPTFTLSTFSEKIVTVDLKLVAGTATEGSDFTLPAGFPSTLTFQPGETTQSVNVTILGDYLSEADEAFGFVLSNPSNAVIKDIASAIRITNDDNAPALTINSVNVTEGDTGTTAMTFTVSLLGASGSTVTVDFKTKDGGDTTGARALSGLPDYLATSGTLVFEPGETTKTITVQIVNDLYAENTENFSVELSNPQGAGLANADGTASSAATISGTGTIENGGDTVIGIFVSDIVKLEGDNTRAADYNKADFVVELSKPTDTAVNFSALTRNGTALAGVTSDGGNTYSGDYLALVEDGDSTVGGNDFVIEAGQISKTVSISLVGDFVFEATETFFLSIGNVSTNATIVRSEARATILNEDIQFLNNNRTAQYVDEDGDLVTVTITKGVLNAAFADTVNSGRVLTFSDPIAATGGRILKMVDFTLAPTLFNGTSLSITADPQAGFETTGLTSNGRVDVGYIRGAQVQSTVLQFVNGIDFGSITVEGDVGKITAGDSVVTPSVRGKLSVFSLGLRGQATLPSDELAVTGSGSTAQTGLVSAFLSTVNAIDVETDVQGTIQVVGGNYGNLKTLKIGGALQGNQLVNSGVVFFTGTLGNATIGSIVGGSAANSGLINGRTDMVGNIGNLHVLGDIVGGGGDNSGRVVGKAINSVVVDGSIIGGGVTSSNADPSGTDSGEIFAALGIKTVRVGGDLQGGRVGNTGQIFSNGYLNSVTIGGSVIGTAASDSGKIFAGQNLGNLTVLGNIVGGDGLRSGFIQAQGNINKVTLGSSGGVDDGNLIGGSGGDSGTISAGAVVNFNLGAAGVLTLTNGTLGTALIWGDVQGGSGDGSGAVQAGTQITKLDLRGSLLGGDSLGGALETSSDETFQTGFVLAGRIATMIVGGDVRSGIDYGNGLLDSGSIRSNRDIGSLTIKGDVVGSADARVVISAGTSGAKVNGVTAAAIAKLSIGGDSSYLDIAAGYRGVNLSATTVNPLGSAYNPDVAIGTVTLGGDVLATNIIAGTTPGADGRFGTADDKVIANPTQITDNPKILASIAKVVFNGQILNNDDDYGISAQHVASVIASQFTVSALEKGSGNDFNVRLDADNPDANMWINEVEPK